MNHLAISLSLIIITALLSALFILTNKPYTKVKTTWGIFNLIVSIWAASLLYSSTSPDYNSAIALARFSQNMAILIPMIFFHFTCILLNIENIKKHIIITFYAISLILNVLLILIPNFFIPSIRPILDLTYYIKAGDLYILIPLFYLLTIGYSLVLILEEYNNSNFNRKNQLKYVFIAYILGALGGLTGFAPTFNLELYPYGFYLVIFNILLVLYAIGRHKLMDIKIAFNKSITYTLLVSSLSFIYFCTVFIIENIFKNKFGYNSLPTSLILISIISLFFTPIKNLIMKIIDKYLYKGSIHEINKKVELLEREVAEKEKFKTVATLASGMCHEIKNPLTAIKTFSEYLPKKLEDKEFLINFSKIVSSEVNRIDNIVNQLLTYSKPSPLIQKETNIHKLIDETLDFLNSKFIEKHINITRIYDNDCTTFMVDPNQIRQALLNLFLNSIDATPNNGELCITTALTKNNHFFIISIKDTGIGIEKNKLKYIFDPFFTQKDNGTGLGLSITKTIIEDHDGKISVTSEINKGTTFIIKLPYKRT